MFGILQRYIARELFKTFALTAFGLTLTFSLCGGVLNMLQAEVLSAGQMARVLGYILPVATTLTLPVAALFACAIVYGRLAMDNEIDACKASGVNIHRLLMPALILSLFTGTFTFSFTNYIIPRFIRGLDELVQKDIHKFILQTLTTKGFIRRGPYVLYAGRTTEASENDDIKRVNIEEAAFLEFEGDNLTRLGTADGVQVIFTAASEEGKPVVEAVMYGVRALDVKRTHFYETAQQPFAPMEVSTGSILLRPKWLDLGQLLYYRHHPSQLADAKKRMDNLRELIHHSLYYADLHDRLTTGNKLAVFEDEHRRFDLRADRVKQSEQDLRLTLQNVELVETSKDSRRRYTAGRASVALKSALSGQSLMAHIVLEDNVSFVDEGTPDKPVERRRIDLPGVAIPASFGEQAEHFPESELIGDDLFSDETLPALGIGQQIDWARERLRKDVTKMYLDVVSIIHSRLAFSSSVFVMLVLAAGLGIIFRGGQLLTAFAVSFLPGLFVVVMNIMGRQLSENVGTHYIGLGVMWLAIVAVAVADFVVLTRFLRR